MRADRLEETQQCPRTLREFEAEQPLVLEPVRVATDHVPHVQLGHLVVAHVDHAITGIRDELQQRLLFPAPSDRAMPAKIRAERESS